MDFFKKGQDFLNKNKASSSSTPAAPTATTDAAGQPVQPAQTGQPAEQKQDYGDKAAAFLAKKSGHNVDPKTQEKVTDGARGLYEKFTGKKVNPKFSN